MEANDALIRSLFVTIDRCRWEELPAFFAPSIVYCRPGYPVIAGIDALVDFYVNVRDISAGRHKLLGLMTGNQSGGCWGSFEGVSRGGEALAEMFSEWYELEEGKIRSRRTFFFRPAI